MSNYSVYPILHEINYFEIFSILLQVSVERVQATKSLQQKANQGEHILKMTEILSFVNTQEKAIQSHLRQEKQRIDRELSLVEMLVGGKNKNAIHIMSFFHLSLRIMNQWYPGFQVRVNVTGEYTDLVELYSQFFLLTGLSHRHQQIIVIRKNQLFEKVPFLSLLMKWLQEFSRIQFSKAFKHLYDQIQKLKAQYNEQTTKQPDIILSPRVSKISTRPVSCLIKQRSQSSYNTPQMRRSSQAPLRKSFAKAITIKDLKKYLTPIMDILDVDTEQYFQKKLEPTQNSLYNLMMQRNNGIKQTREGWRRRKLMDQLLK
ncbi:hypothetical protein pb186bvf_001624 [Paramecium bursaria]